jgi:hypothetical protein
MRTASIGIAVLLAVCLAGVYGSSEASAADNFGAISYSNTTGAYGYSYDYPSRGQAEERSLNECAARGTGCKVVLWFRNACGALATGTNYGYGFAWATSRGEAEQVALRYCRKYTNNCKIAVWTCTTR